MRNLLLAFIIILSVVPVHAQVPEQLPPAAKALERSCVQSLGVAHQLFDNATDTHAAWVLMRDVATVRSNAATLVSIVTNQPQHIAAARKLVRQMNELSARIVKLLEDPELGPEDHVMALLAQWTKTKVELDRVTAMMPPAPVPPTAD